MIFPSTPGTRLVLDPHGSGHPLPVVRWVGSGVDDDDPTPLGPRPGCALLVEHARGTFARPGLRGHRLGVTNAPDSRDVAGRAWSTAFVTSAIEVSDTALVIEADDEGVGLTLRTEVEALRGGALRIRHVLTNHDAAPYLLEGLEVSVPVADGYTELLDFTGRHQGERVPQRQQVRDGMWVRESRGGRPGLDSATMLIAGTPGFGFGHGEVIGLAVACTGNSVLTMQRSAADGATLGGGELLLPGEIVLGRDESYASPWVFVVAADDGLDGLAAALHAWQRALPAHPAEQPVTLNVWEAVYFDHDAQRLAELVDLAARVGVERFVLDDGWFRGRRDATAGLGDWYVDDAVWPDGLAPLAERVHAAGMQFGLWFEPEMVNPDSDLYRAHPDWVLSADERTPLLHRNQLVVDLTKPAAWTYLLERIDAILTDQSIDYVKWDHNRPLLEAGSPQHGFAPAAHRQSQAFIRLLDTLRARHPAVAFESCASGGGRIDLGVIEHVQRVWTSDMTDALARQQIQRWTVQLVAPEYLGAHVSAPTSHQTGRTLSLDLRAGIALFGAFGIEWDLTRAGADDLDRLADWVGRYKQWRPLLHAGRTVRIDTADPAVQAQGVVAPDGRGALIAHVQMDESASNRGVVLRVPGLDPGSRYRCTWASPVDERRVSDSAPLDPAGPTGGKPVSGAALARIGLWLPRRRPETVQLIALETTTR